MNRHFRVLGVRAGAGAAEVKRAWRRQARRFHPDVCGDVDAAEKFVEARQAYETLTAPDFREKYEEWRRERAELEREIQRRIEAESRNQVRTRHVEVERARRGIEEPLCGTCGAPARTRATCACSPNWS